MNKQGKAWSDGCAVRVWGGQIDFLRVDSSGIVAALGKSRNEQYVRGTWSDGPKEQKEREAEHWGGGIEAWLCVAFPGKWKALRLTNSTAKRAPYLRKTI